MKPTQTQPLDTELAMLLADYQVFYQKLRGFHWTVTGPLFFGLHAKFEELYLDAAEKVDALAERLVARGARPPLTLKDSLALARLTEDASRPSAEEMVRNVAGDIETLSNALRKAARTAGDAHDTASVNLLDGYADGQEKTLWMLRAFAAS
ncbi:MAG: DNA starvation/stationary phase protection protein [Planctomycetes bacterium]|nr:DNA starvation/stationary phase protection protein [Planctomycetota bacterium]